MDDAEGECSSGLKYGISVSARCLLGNVCWCRVGDPAGGEDLTHPFYAARPFPHTNPVNNHGCVFHCCWPLMQTIVPAGIGGEGKIVALRAVGVDEAPRTRRWWGWGADVYPCDICRIWKWRRRWLRVIFTILLIIVKFIVIRLLLVGGFWLRWCSR